MKLSTKFKEEHSEYIEKLLQSGAENINFMKEQEWVISWWVENLKEIVRDNGQQQEDNTIWVDMDELLSKLK
jgi:hypothetical protein